MNSVLEFSKIHNKGVVKLSKYTADDFDGHDEDTSDDDEQTSSREDSRSYAYDHDVVELKERNAQLEQRIAAQEWRELAAKKQAISRDYEYLDRAEQESADRLAMAIAEANGDDAARALRTRDEAKARKEELRQSYQQLEQIERQAAAKPAKPPAVDAKVHSLAKDWIRKHSWYDVNGGNEDSRIVLEIDSKLAREGYVPRTELYWKELDKRVARNLPHRYENRGSESVSTKKPTYISRERKEALISAGVWDDPVLRSKYVKQYQKWDKENNL